MGERTRSRIGTAEGVKTVRVFSANPKTADGFNTFIFRRDIARSLNKLAWAPVIDARQNSIPVGIALSDDRVEYSREQKKTLILFLVEQLRKQYGPVDNDDFGRFGLQRLFAKEVQRHALATRREYVSTFSARAVASGMVHFAAAPNEEIVRRNGIRYFEYGLAKVQMDDGLYLVMGEVGVRSGSSPYYDQHVVAKFKADSEVSSLQGHIRIGESAFEHIYDNRFRLILQGVEMYYNSTQTISNQTNKQLPRFSIIIPAYNVAPYLQECLDSVLAQDFKDWECVVVDDESTDEGPRILDEYAAKDKRIRVIHQKNKGEGGARNSGLAAAKGEWIFFLDGDDVMASGSLVRLNKIIESNPAEKLIRFGNERFQDGTVWVPSNADGAIVRKDVSARIPMSDFFTYVWQHLYRREVIDGILFKGYKRGCDRVFVDDVLLNRVHSFVETSESLYGYRVRAGSAMHSVPSTQVLKDEMWHRRDIVLMIEASEKQVEYAGSYWLEVYFTKEVGQLIMQKSPRDRVELWNVWIGCIDEMRRAKGLSRSTRRIYNLCGWVRCRPFWRLLCCSWPWYSSHGIMPKGLRMILRAVAG